MPVLAIIDVLELIPGAKPELIESSCCGMTGSFGYEASHYEVSMQMAELSLLPSWWSTAPAAGIRSLMARSAKRFIWR